MPLSPFGGNPDAGEGVAFWRELAQADEARFGPTLADALVQTSMTEFRRDNALGALAAIEEAATVGERLVQRDGSQYKRGHAQTLHIYATRLADVGRTTEALVQFDRAISILRRLVQEVAEANPASLDRFDPKLALCLSDKAWLLLLLERWADAMSVSEESLDIYLTLVKLDPDKHTKFFLRTVSIQSQATEQLGN